MGEARHMVFVTGLRGIVLDGELRGLPVDTVLNQGQVVGLHFDADRVEAFDECGLNRGAASRERVEDGASWRGDEPDQPSHDREGLHGGVLYAVHVRTLRLRGLRGVEEPRRATGVRVRIAGVVPPEWRARKDVRPLGPPLVAYRRFRGNGDPALFVYPCGGVLVE